MVRAMITKHSMELNNCNKKKCKVDLKNGSDARTVYFLFYFRDEDASHTVANLQKKTTTTTNDFHFHCSSFVVLPQ